MDRAKIQRIAHKLVIFLLFCWHNVHATPFTLIQAEQAALAQSPEIKSLQAKTHQFSQEAIAAGQLPDPKLMLGTINVPVNTFNLAQEPMTQIQVGIGQSFPRGRSLHYRAIQKNDLSTAESHKQKVMQLQVLQAVRQSWLNVYYWRQTKQIILNQKVIFKHLLKVTESMLANNQAQQKDVIRAQLELTELDNRLLNIEQELTAARAELARWVGPNLAEKALPTQLPIWPTPPSAAQMQSMIKQHPVLKTDAALIAASRAGVHLAEQQYKPGFNASLAYGFRQNRHFEERSNRPDFITAQVSVDLPILTHNRQDRLLKASQENLTANREEQISHHRQLIESLEKQTILWQQEKKRASLYRKSLIPEAKQYAAATMTAYQNALTDFPTLARAYIRELDTELAGLKANVARDIARINLLYLQGK